LDLSFCDKALRYICESEARARKVLGANAAADLHARLSDLEAVDAITEITWALIEYDASQAQLEFHPGFRLLVEANEIKAPITNGVIDWTRVGRILLKEITQP